MQINIWACHSAWFGVTFTECQELINNLKRKRILLFLWCLDRNQKRSGLIILWVFLWMLLTFWPLYKWGPLIGPLWRCISPNQSWVACLQQFILKCYMGSLIWLWNLCYSSTCACVWKMDTSWECLLDKIASCAVLLHHKVNWWVNFPLLLVWNSQTHIFKLISLIFCKSPVLNGNRVLEITIMMRWDVISWVIMNRSDRVQLLTSDDLNRRFKNKVSFCVAKSWKNTLLLCGF